MPISKAEIDYIVTGAERNIRGDGRKRTEYRRFHIETGVVAQASGSCRLRLDGTDILVGIKVEVGSIVPERADDAEDEQEEEAGEGQAGGPSYADVANDVEEGLRGPTENRGRVVCNVEWLVLVASGLAAVPHACLHEPALRASRASLQGQKAAKTP